MALKRMYNASQRILDGIHKKLELAALSELCLLLESLSDGHFWCLQSLAALLRVPGDVLEGFVGAFPLFILLIQSMCSGLSGAAFLHPR